MECERVREEFIERLTGTLDPDRARAMDDHLAGCAACREETDRMRAMWAELGSLEPKASAGNAARRLERLIDARSGTAGVGASGPRADLARPPHLPRTALVSAAIAASLLVGVVVGRRSVTPVVEGSERQVAVTPAANPTKQQYLLLLEGPARTGPAGVAPSAADSAAERALVQEYGAWAGRLARSGVLVMAEKLADDEITIHARGGVIAPMRNPAEEVGGFFLIQVADSAEAHRIARECPHLKYGGTVQVRRIEPT
jgi:hypothetical protein